MGATMTKNGNLLDALPSQGTLHVCMLGLDSAGKTTALYRLKFDQYLNTVPTIGFNCEKIQGTVGKAKGVHFLVWDVGGQEKLRPLWRSYTRCTDGILFVVDSVDTERMEEAKMELMRTAKCPDNQGVPVLILANKQDLPNACSPKELEKLLGLQELHHPVQSLSGLKSASSSTSNIIGYSTQSQSQTGRSLTPTTPNTLDSSGHISNKAGDKNISKALLISSSYSRDESDKNDCVNTGDIKNCVSFTTSPASNIIFTKKFSSKASTSIQFKGWYIQPACAITGEGLQEGLDALYDMILKRRKMIKSHKKKR